MKKVLVGLTVLLLSACSFGSMSSPKQVVSSFLDKYKNQDQSIISQLEDTINLEFNNDDYKARYKTLMTNQYKDMEYTIKDEIIEGDNAVVDVNVTVYDYASSIKNANDYLNKNPDKFMKDDTKKESDTTDTTGILANYDEEKFIDYKLNEMEKVTDKVTYTMEFTLTKKDGKWEMDSLSNTDIEKLHGIYLSKD